MRRIVASLTAAALFVTATVAHAAKTIPYDEHQGVPLGYHVEERPRTAMAIVGGSMFAVGATLFTYGVIEHQRAVDKNAASEDPQALQNPGSGGSALMWGGGLVAVVGLPLLLVGLTSKRKVLVSDNIDMTPVVSPGFSGLSLSGTF